jgi:ABC-type transporter Mla subunit MlaD
VWDGTVGRLRHKVFSASLWLQMLEVKRRGNEAAAQHEALAQRQQTSEDAINKLQHQVATSSTSLAAEAAQLTKELAKLRKEVDDRLGMLGKEIAELDAKGETNARALTKLSGSLQHGSGAAAHESQALREMIHGLHRELDKLRRQTEEIASLERKVEAMDGALPQIYRQLGQLDSLARHASDVDSLTKTRRSQAADILQCLVLLLEQIRIASEKDMASTDKQFQWVYDRLDKISHAHRQLYNRLDEPQSGSFAVGGELPSPATATPRSRKVESKQPSWFGDFSPLLAPLDSLILPLVVDDLELDLDAGVNGQRLLQTKDRLKDQRVDVEDAVQLRFRIHPFSTQRVYEGTPDGSLSLQAPPDAMRFLARAISDALDRLQNLAAEEQVAYAIPA